MSFKDLPPNNQTILGKASFPNREADDLFAAVERVEENQVKLSLLQEQDLSAQDRGWFTPGIVQMVNGKLVAESAEPEPNHIVVQTLNGVITLLNCEFAGSQRTIGGSGTVHLRPQITVFGATHPDNIGAVRSVRAEITGLHEWLSASLIREQEVSAKHMLLRVETPDDIILEKSAEFQDSLTFSARKKSDSATQTTLSQAIKATSQGKSLNTWKDSLQFIHDLRNLLTLSAGKLTIITSLEALFFSPEERPSSWVPVLSDEVNTQPPRQRFNFLFTFNDIGVEGINKWRSLYKTYERALAPFFTMYESEANYAPVNFSMLGLALEALGINLFINKDNLTDHEANKKRLENNLQRVLDELGSDFEKELAWFPERMKTAYNSHKHGRLVDPLEMVILCEISTSIIRSWVCLELGIDHQAVLSNFKERFDPNNYKLVVDPSEVH